MEHIHQGSPILDLCRSGVRQRGTSKRQWWWEQPFEADPEREEDASSIISEYASEADSLLSVEYSIILYWGRLQSLVQ